jgi:hypothetical protein
MDKQGYLPQDVIQYQSDCEAGEFYNNFMKVLNVPDDLRPDFKADFFSKLFFSMFKRWPNFLRTLFIETYPSCWEAICHIKGGLNSKDYNKFAIKLQEVEANIIFDAVNVALMKQGIKAFNIFDSMYVNNRNDFEIARQLTVDAFKQYGLNPKLKIEYEEHLVENEHRSCLGLQIQDQNSSAGIDKVSAIEEELTIQEQKDLDEWDRLSERIRKNNEVTEMFRQIQYKESREKRHNGVRVLL